MRRKTSDSLSALRAFLASNHLRPVDLARALGISQPAAGAIIAGRVSPKPRTRIAIELWTGCVRREGWDTNVEAELRSTIGSFAAGHRRIEPRRRARSAP